MKRSRIILLILLLPGVVLHLAQALRGEFLLQDVAETPADMLLHGRTQEGHPVGLIRSADGTLLMACAGYSYDVLPFGIATRNGLTVVLSDGSRHSYTRLWWADVEDRFGWLGVSYLDKCVSLIFSCADGASEVAVNGHLYRTVPPLPAPRYTEQDVLQKLHDYFRN